MPISQHAPTTSTATFIIESSAPLVDLATRSVIAAASARISPLLISSTMVNACFATFVTITNSAVRADSIKIEPRRYRFKTMCPTPGNIRPDRSAAFVELVISSSGYLTPGLRRKSGSRTLAAIRRHNAHSEHNPVTRATSIRHILIRMSS